MSGTRYIQSTLVSNERVVYTGELHAFCYVFPLALIALGLLIMYTPGVPENTPEIEVDPEGWIAQTYHTIMMWFRDVRKAIPEQLAPLLDLLAKARKYYLGTLFAAFGFGKLVWTFIKKKTMEHAVTNKKVIQKKGFIAVDTNELNLERIEGVKVHQTAFDRMINKGRVHITGIGMEQINMRGMKDPAKLRQAILEAMDRFVHH